MVSPVLAAFDLAPILYWTGNLIYVLQAITAIHGTYLCVMVFRRIAQKRFRSATSADNFIADVVERTNEKDFDGVAEICDSPPYWSRASAQLILVALANREKPLPKLRQLLAERFEGDVLTDLDYRVAWINTIVKTAPMLGLQGTVVGMIEAFAKIAASSKTGVDPGLLANDISFALFTTAIGLMVAIPLTICLAAIHVRKSKLQDNVQEHLTQFLEAFEPALNGGSSKRK